MARRCPSSNPTAVGLPRCILVADHAGDCVFPTDADDDGYLPRCGLCGKLAIRCGCAWHDAQGRSVMIHKDDGDELPDGKPYTAPVFPPDKVHPTFKYEEYTGPTWTPCHGIEPRIDCHSCAQAWERDRAARERSGRIY